MDIEVSFARDMVLNDWSVTRSVPFSVTSSNVEPHRLCSDDPRATAASLFRYKPGPSAIIAKKRDIPSSNRATVGAQNNTGGEGIITSPRGTVVEGVRDNPSLGGTGVFERAAGNSHVSLFA